MDRGLTPATYDRAKAESGADRTFIWDAKIPGFGLQVTPSGRKSFVFQYRIGGISRRMKLDGGWFRHEAERADRAAPKVSGSPLVIARREAQAVQGAIAQGRDPLEEMRKAMRAKSNTLRAIAEEYFKLEGSRLRSKAERQRVFDRYVFPKLGSRPIDTIRRSDIARLLETIEVDNGPVQADHVLAAVRKLFNWHAARSDDFNSPIVRGMARTKPAERQRQRILSDDELRAIWRASEAEGGPFGHLVRFILLTACRRNEAAKMRRQEVVGRDWTIPGARHKSKKDFLLPLSGSAAAALASIPTIGRKGIVFTFNGEKPINGFTKFKAQLDKASGVAGWRLHDLRRTARTLMSRAGVDPDHAERALGHVLPGIRKVYDVHAFREEKARAFEILAAQLDLVLNPRPNVVSIKGTRHAEAIS